MQAWTGHACEQGHGVLCQGSGGKVFGRKAELGSLFHHVKMSMWNIFKLKDIQTKYFQTKYFYTEYFQTKYMQKNIIICVALDCIQNIKILIKSVLALCPKKWQCGGCLIFFKYNISFNYFCKGFYCVKKLHKVSNAAIGLGWGRNWW